MSNAELIAELREFAGPIDCSHSADIKRDVILIHRAADALEAAEKEREELKEHLSITQKWRDKYQDFAESLKKDIARLEAELKEAKERAEQEKETILKFAVEQCNYCIGHPSGLFAHYTGERIARYIKSRIADKMLLDGFIKDTKKLKAPEGGKHE
ncbi:hypothetical protein HUU59_10995 [bacterium]|nr:hypothetical protein [bacterium]